MQFSLNLCFVRDLMPTCISHHRVSGDDHIGVDVADETGRLHDGKVMLSLLSA